MAHCMIVIFLFEFSVAPYGQSLLLTYDNFDSNMNKCLVFEIHDLLLREGTHPFSSFLLLFCFTSTLNHLCVCFWTMFLVMFRFVFYQEQAKA